MGSSTIKAKLLTLEPTNSHHELQIPPIPVRGIAKSRWGAFLLKLNPPHAAFAVLDHLGLPTEPRPQSGSIAIDFGLDVGLPYNGSAIDAGACDYGGIDEGPTSIHLVRVPPGSEPQAPRVPSTNAGFSALPAIVANEGGLQAAWFDTRDGGREIYGSRLSCE